MPRIIQYLGTTAVVVLGIIFIVFLGNVTVIPTVAPVTQNASSTLSVLPSLTLPPITAPSFESKSATVASSSQARPVPVPKKNVPPPITKTSHTSTSTPTSTPIVAPVLIPTPISLAPSGNAGLDASASLLRAALVNIICYAPAGSRLRSISGSGVIVDPKGIILTNAHIAQNFLLADRNVSCTIRAGSPAIDKYKASLIYIPSLWVSANAKILTESNPSGTGEYDFAFLAISKSITRDELPSYFPSIPLATSPPDVGTPVVIASYGAQFLESSQIQSALFPTVVFGSVKDVFTFANNTIDVLALGGSAAAQEGSSGGGVADASGKLVGTITTSTTKGTTDTRKLDAITASYIRAAYANETGTALDILFTQPIAQSVSAFASKIPSLESILTAQLH